MGTKQTKGAGPDPGSSPQQSGWKRTPTKQRGDIFASFMLRSGDRFGRGGPPPPYQRRIGMIQEMMVMAKEGKQNEVTELLKTLRQDLGMESTSLDDVLYRYASFRSLVDPITHDLIISLARYVHCPKTEGDALCAMEKVCRQLTYHLSPHSRWRRQGLLKRKPQACLKVLLSGPPTGGTVDLSGIPLGVRDVERLSAHLQRHAARVCSLELGFTELTDEAFLLLLPTLGALPRLETLALNGNRLTRAVLRDLTDVLKDPASFPAVTWIDLGNNVDIFSLPQPFLVSLRKRCPKQGNLPTILEFGESQASEPEGRAGAGVAGDDGTCTESTGELGSDTEGESDAGSEGHGIVEMIDQDNETLGRGEEVMGEDGAWGERERWRAEEKESGGGGDDARGERNGERKEEAEGKEEIPTCSFQHPCAVQSQETPGHIQPIGGQEGEGWATSDQT
ncbi:leucine-rich repeat-containing protein 75A-like [Anguilla rostrata]|uniref:leucine-rich repeat-containing protein 75A-like n=1 Tax=Anguilla rostrata TaxID=7938 RepID=UPI0030CC1365